MRSAFLLETHVKELPTYTTSLGVHQLAFYLDQTPSHSYAMRVI